MKSKYALTWKALNDKIAEEKTSTETRENRRRVAANALPRQIMYWGMRRRYDVVIIAARKRGYWEHVK